MPKKVQRFCGFIYGLLGKEACRLAGVFQQMDCDATSAALCVRTGNLLHATETTDNLVVWGAFGSLKA